MGSHTTLAITIYHFFCSSWYRHKSGQFCLSFFGRELGLRRVELGFEGLLVVLRLINMINKATLK